MVLYGNIHSFYCPDYYFVELMFLKLWEDKDCAFFYATFALETPIRGACPQPSWVAPGSSFLTAFTHEIALKGRLLITLS